MAGHFAQVDRNRGFGVSPSNKKLLGITSLERIPTWSPSGEGTEATGLNSRGITTFRSKNVLWGNRSSAYPNSTNVKTFVSVRRTSDIIDASLRVSFLQFVDEPITQALIDTMLQVGNAYLGTLKGDGQILDGRLSYDTAKNPPSELALGRLVFDRTITPVVPAEDTLIKSSISLEGFAVIQ